MKEKTGFSFTFLIGAVLGLIIFSIDVSLPYGKVAALLYFVPIILLSWKYGTVKTLYSLAVLYGLLALLKFVFYKDATPPYAVFNRTIFIIILSVITLIQGQRKKSDSALVKANLALKESEERYRMSFERAASGIAHMTPDGRWLKVNDKYCEILGYSREDLEHLTYKDITHPDDLKADLENRNKLLAGKIDSFSIEKRYIRKDGNPIWTFLTCSLAQEESTGLTYFISVIDDKSEDIRLREELENVARFPDENPNPVMRISEGGGILYLNTASRAVLPELISSVGECVPEDWQNIVKTALVNNRQIEIEYECRERTFLMLYYPVQSKNYVNIYGRDITDRKRIEKALSESEDRFRQLADSMPQLMGTTDEKGVIIYYNRQWYEYTGLSAGESFGFKRRNVFYPEDLPDALKAWRKSFEKGELFEYTARLRRKDGSSNWFLIRVIPVKDKNGKVMKWIGTGTNIQEQKMIQEKLEQTLTDLERSNKELEQFAYVASHDLQEPIRMVSSYVKLLEQRYKGQLDEKALHYINFAADGSKRMASLIKDLLAFSRITSKAKEFESIDLNDVLENVKEDLQVSIKETGAKITSVNLPRINADATQMRQLLQNLIGNAIKFCDGKPPEINIKVEKRNNDWLFSVRDNGIGIDPEYHERIFLIFQRLHERNKYSGTGIGLAICKKIVERHGGKIWLESEAGKGTTFYFNIKKG